MKPFIARLAMASLAVWIGLCLTLVTVGLAEVYLLRRPVSGIGQAVLAAVSSLSDLDDVSDTLSPGDGDVLKFSGGEWTAGTDQTSGAGTTAAQKWGLSQSTFPDIITCADGSNNRLVMYLGYVYGNGNAEYRYITNSTYATYNSSGTLVGSNNLGVYTCPSLGVASQFRMSGN